MHASTQQSSATSATTLLSATGLSKTYRMGESTIHVLKKADLVVRDGEFIAIEGRSGSGKSTLLHILGALDTVDGGEISFAGRDYTASTKKPTKFFVLALLSRIAFWLTLFAIAVCAVSWVLGLALQRSASDWAPATMATFKISLIAGIVLLVLWIVLLIVRSILYYVYELPFTKLRNESFGFVFQFYHLLPELNVLENTLLAPKVKFSTTGFMANQAERVARATSLLREFGLEDRLKHRPNQLSGGERQRVAIARALMNSPRVLFADEPTGNLDAETGKQIMGVLEKLHRENGQTIVMVTHDRTLARQADRVLVLKDGRLEATA